VGDETIGRRLQWVTIVWNVAEVFITFGLGIAAGSLALIAFGLDSMIEVFASLVVLWHMGPAAPEDKVARDHRARRLVALAFGMLAAYLLIAAVRSLWVGDEPDAVMFTLARAKWRVGQRLESEPFLAEATMTFLDGCLALAILTALALNAVLDWWWADPLAALIVSVAAANEARELLDS